VHRKSTHNSNGSALNLAGDRSQTVCASFSATVGLLCGVQETKKKKNSSKDALKKERKKVKDGKAPGDGDGGPVGVSPDP
jgi:hypothetical protein